MAEKDERERIREQKKKELMEKLDGDGASAGGPDGTGEAQSTEDAPTDPIEITGESHLQEVTSTYDVVLVDCYADWCGPCQMMEPTIEALAAETDAAVAKVDVDANQRLAQQLGARGVPTLVVYSHGEPVERMVGAQDRATLERLLQQAG